MEEHMDNQTKWQTLERAAIPYLKDCLAYHAPASVRLHERALEYLMQRRPELPFRPADLFEEDEARWSQSTRKRLLICIVRFGRWAERHTGMEVLRS